MILDFRSSPPLKNLSRVALVLKADRCRIFTWDSHVKSSWVGPLDFCVQVVQTVQTR